MRGWNGVCFRPADRSDWSGRERGIHRPLAMHMFKHTLGLREKRNRKGLLVAGREFRLKLAGQSLLLCQGNRVNLLSGRMEGLDRPGRVGKPGFPPMRMIGGRRQGGRRPPTTGHMYIYLDHNPFGSRLWVSTETPSRGDRMVNGIGSETRRVASVTLPFHLFTVQISESLRGPPKWTRDLLKSSRRRIQVRGVWKRGWCLLFSNKTRPPVSSAKG